MALILKPVLAQTDKDKDDFLCDSFQLVADVFENSLLELKARHKDIDVRFERLDRNRFTATAYRNGKKTSAITVYRGGMGFNGREINFNNDDAGKTNASNGSFQVIEQDEQLRFQNVMGAFTMMSKNVKLDAALVAEEIWSHFMEPLQRHN